jgi:enamine deaminase RidA (YjgF/YER057c/UK114 family)
MAESRFVTLAADSARSRLASDVVIAGELAFVSGVRAVDLNNDRMPLPEKVEAQVDKIFANLDLILKAAGLDRRNVVAVKLYVFDFKQLFERVNTAYLRCIGDAPLPARTCVGVAQLTRGAQVEMDFVVRTGIQ